MYSQKHSNPFCLKPVWEPGKFFGRRQVTRQVLELLDNGEVVYLDGSAKIGKTSFLAFVAHPDTRRAYSLATDRTFVYLDNRALVTRDVGQYYLSVIKAIVRQVRTSSTLDATVRQELEDAANDADPASPSLGLMDLCQVAQDCGLRLILVLDDADWLAARYGEHTNLFNSLRALTTTGQVGYLIASQVPLHHLEKTRPEASPFFNIGHWMSLGPLAPKESSEMIKTLLEQADIVFPQFVQDQILELGQNEPYRLQLAGQIAVQVWQENGGQLTGTDQLAIGERFSNECQSG